MTTPAQQQMVRDWRNECRYTNREFWEWKKDVLILENPTWTDNLYYNVRDVTPDNFAGVSLVVGMVVIGSFGLRKWGLLKLLTGKR